MPGSDIALYGSVEAPNCFSNYTTTKPWCALAITSSPYTSCVYYYLAGTVQPDEYQFGYCFGDGELWDSGTCPEGGYFATRRKVNGGSWENDPY